MDKINITDEKVAVLYHPTSEYSNYFIKNIKVVKEFNLADGDRVNFFPTLVHLVPCHRGDRLYEFIPIKYADAQAVILLFNQFESKIYT